MAKIPRRVQPVDESSDEDESSEQEAVQTAKKRKASGSNVKLPTAKKSKKPKSESEGDEDAEPEVKPRSSKVAKQKKQSDVSSSDVPLKEDGGTKYIDLGKMKRASISEFKGQRFVDIREYYVDKSSGEGKPGKKGIALNAEQWKMLKQSISTIDELFSGK